MLPNLDLPPLEEGPTPSDIKPALLRDRLTRLSQGAPADAARALADGMALLNRVVVSFQDRLLMVEIYNEAAEKLWSPLKRHFSNQAHPLSLQALQAAKNTLFLAGEIAVGYKRLLLEGAQKHFRDKQPRIQLGIVLRTQQALARNLLFSFSSYCPVAPGIWRDMHQVYCYARSQDLHLHHINPQESSLTPELSYLQALLLALANPYGFLPGQLNRVVAYLGEHSHLAKLTDSYPRDLQSFGIATILSDEDQPPQAANVPATSADTTVYFLQTNALVAQLHHQLKTLESGQGWPARIAGEEFKPAQYTDLLHRLARHWSLAPVRKIPRLFKQGTLTICSGFSAVWQVLPTSTGSAPQDAVISLCSLINHTANGYALRQTRQMLTPIRVGELMAIRSHPGAAWQIAVVRWFRNTMQNQTLEFGCEVLATEAKAVTLLPRTGGQGPFVPALHLPASATQEQNAALLTEAGVLAVNRSAILKQDEQQQTITPTQMIEQSVGFELFSYTVSG